MNRSKSDKRRMYLIDPDSGQACTVGKVDSGSTKPYSHKLRFLAACMWVLTIALPAAAQDVEEQTAAPAPSAALPESEPLPPPPASPAGEDPEAPMLEVAAAPRRAAGTERSLKEVVVTGYRKSLGAALEKKQRSTSQVDAIVAEDMADFPDLNLADSLQRVPGISVTRSNGEGGRVTVRGLTGHYTRTRLNGMDAQASDVDNQSREFDFNLFASELFNSILIHKTASAELGEGSLGSVIDLGTGRPFSFKKGFSFVAGAQGNYNDLSDTVRPRLTGLLNYHDPGGRWGASASVAYSRSRNDGVTSESGRWEKARFGTVEGNSCWIDPIPPATARTPSTDPKCAEVANAYGARFPRYMTAETVSERLGVTAGLQFKPFSKTEIRLDGLFAKYDKHDEVRMLENLLRGNQTKMDVTSYTVVPHPDLLGDPKLPNNDLTALGLNNTWIRSETYRNLAENQFYQLTLAVDQEFTSSVYAKALVGRSVSSAYRPHSSTLMYDIRDYNNYSYDYTQNQDLPSLKYGGVDVMDPANFTLTELRDQEAKTRNTFDTAELKLFWEVMSQLRIATGATFKRMAHDTWQNRRDGQTCGLKLADGSPMYVCEGGALGPKGERGLSHTTNYPGEVGAGSTTSWASASYDEWVNRLNYYNVPLIADRSRTRKVQETNFGGFLQADGEFGFGSGMRLNYNAGLQYVQTRQESSGYQGNDWTEIKRDPYGDFLPSGNLAFWPIETLVVRASAAQVMARPLLAHLSPGATVDSFQYRVNYQNINLDPTRALAFDASLEWYFQKESVLSLALFRKDIESFPIEVARTGTYASTGLPLSMLAPTSPAEQNPEGLCGKPEGCWEVTKRENGPGATINGLELGFQAPFSAFYAHLPPVIRGLGVIANVTLINSKTMWTYNKDHQVEEKLTGLSAQAFNATLYYDSPKFGIRGSVAHRSSYKDDTATNINGNLFQYIGSSTRFDASAKYKIIDQLEVTVEALNLLNTPERSSVDRDTTRMVTYRKTGRNFLLGARYSY